MDMPHFGYNFDPFEKPLPEIRKAKKLGADYIEIYVSPPPIASDFSKNALKIRKALEKSGIYATLHMAYWADLGTEIEHVRKAWIEEAKRSATLAGDMGARKMVAHARVQGMSMLFPKSRKEVMKNFVESFSEIAEHAHRHGVRLVIENEPFAEKRMLVKDFVYLAKRVKKAGITLDTGHAYIGNGNDTVKDFIRRVGGRIEHCHFSDNHGTDDEHLPIGMGDLNYDMIVSELKRIRYKRTITLEIFQGGDKGFTSSLKKLKGLWQSERRG
ncbi:MAG: hypothetical protein DRO99_00865 [Candidatus Aenigmatarchaeota archaeon]|nr:MAG: hypothetical protein DRO99_00865 [Candidatus Aenigmarchaeota archaeon]